MVALHDAIVLHQVHTLQRNVKPRLIGVLEQHEFAAASVGLDLPQAIELPYAMIDVYYEIAWLELRKIAEETRRANLTAGALNRRRHIKKIRIPEKRHARVRKRHAFGKRCANQQQCGGLRRGFRSEPR